MSDNELITTHRLEALTDGIFAFSMTLLVLFIETPKSHHLHDPQQLQIYLREQYPQFIGYLVTFLVLSNFWIIHHNISRFIIKTNYINLWLNIVFMLFIVLLPFTSMIIGDYPQSWGGIFLFAGNLFCIINLLLIIWLYASHHRRLLNPDMNLSLIRSVTAQLSVGTSISVVSMVTCFFYPKIALYVYLLIPIFIIIRHFYHIFPINLFSAKTKIHSQ